jgi:hypothetical protein
MTPPIDQPITSLIERIEKCLYLSDPRTRGMLPLTLLEQALNELKRIQTQYEAIEIDEQ